MATALITHLDCLSHAVLDGAPERPARLSRVLQSLEDAPLERFAAPRATDAQIASVHDPDYIAHIRREIPEEGLIALDADTQLSPHSMDAILRGVGGAIAAVDLVLDEQVENAFVATRPPGHHAEQARAMGFCFFGNTAIAAKHALDTRGLERVAIVDFDVHHGNGTMALLADEPRALVVSSHQMPLWPGSGYAEEVGPHNTLVNVPLAPHSGTAELQAAYNARVFPALEAFKPELIILSAGFDAHQDDPLAQLWWSRSDYVWLTQELAKSAQTLCEGRLVSVLEGGYDLEALAGCVRAHVDELVKAGS